MHPHRTDAMAILRYTPFYFLSGLLLSLIGGAAGLSEALRAAFGLPALFFFYAVMIGMAGTLFWSTLGRQARRHPRQSRNPRVYSALFLALAGYHFTAWLFLLQGGGPMATQVFYLAVFLFSSAMGYRYALEASLEPVPIDPPDR